MCLICTTPVERLTRVTTLYCSSCPLLTSIPPTLVNLRVLYCSGCPLLSSIPATLTGLTDLDCCDCPLLSFIPPTLVNLTWVECSNCPRLASIPAELTRLIHLDCSDCRMLTSVPLAAIQWMRHEDCPWLPQNAAAYPTHFSSLLRLQRWFRYGKKQVFKRVVRTRAFNEFIFDPSRIGGKLVKRQMEAELGAMRPVNEQRVE